LTARIPLPGKSIFDESEGWRHTMSMMEVGERSIETGRQSERIKRWRIEELK
jgi:hypothetical protein